MGDAPAVVSDRAGVPVVVISGFAAPATLVINDIIKICKIPCNHLLVDFVVICDAHLDTDDAIVASIGALNADGSTISNALTFNSSLDTILREGGSVTLDRENATHAAVPTLMYGCFYNTQTISAVKGDQFLAMKITTAATSAAAANLIFIATFVPIMTTTGITTITAA